MTKSLERKGIILAGGTGSRLYPLTNGISKQLLPVYDKPMIYYPICTLMQAGIREILLITNKTNIEAFKRLIGDGSQWGINIQFKIQVNPDGLAQSFIIGSDFINDHPSCLILGDNLFYGFENNTKLEKATKKKHGGTIFAYQVSDPERYGVVEFNKDKKVISIEEKPKVPLSKFAVTGLYFYDNDCVNISKTLKPSKRGELEITDLNKAYLNKNKLDCKILGRGFSWLDTGTHESLLLASQFVQIIEERTGTKIACLEEIALNNKWISISEIRRNNKDFVSGNYYNYLQELSK